jgi:hypothetical protein
MSIRYKIMVCDGSLALAHGAYRDIDEIYIPDLCLYINGEAAFLGDEKRAKVGPIESSREEHEIDDEGLQFLLKKLARSLKVRDDSIKIIREKLNLEGPVV